MPAPSTMTQEQIAAAIATMRPGQVLTLRYHSGAPVFTPGPEQKVIVESTGPHTFCDELTQRTVAWVTAAGGPHQGAVYILHDRCRIASIEQ